MSSGPNAASIKLSENDELLQVQKRCKELREEKDTLKESQSESFHLIRGLESRVKALSEARTEDKKLIQELERELSNCSQEIDYLQDQLNARDSEFNSLSNHICDLELKLNERESLEEIINNLRQELKQSSLERMVLMEELGNKEMELQKLTLYLEKEESISFVPLEYQCEIESIKIDLMALEQRCFEATKLQAETAQENTRLCELVQDIELQIVDYQKGIECLDKENRELRRKLEASYKNARLFVQKMENQFQELVQSKETSSSTSVDEKDPSEVLDELLSRLVVVREPDAHSKEVDGLSSQIQEYEVLVSHLKEQLKEEKLKAKEEAEDLAQEMAELRYHITGLLEEECKRRACIEQISLQRITDLEAQIEKEQKKKSFAAFRDIH